MDGLERVAIVPERHRLARRPAMVRGATFRVSDLLAVTTAWLSGGAVLHAVAFPGLADSFSPTGAPGLLWLSSAIGVVLWLASRQHHNLRLPWSTQLSDVLAGSAVALAGTAAVGSLLSTFDYADLHQLAGYELISSTCLALWLMSWMIFVLALILARTFARGILRARGFWTLRTIIVAPADVAEKIEAAFRSDRRLGFHVVGCLDPADSRQALQLRQIDPVQTDLLVVAAGLDASNSTEQTIADLRGACLPIATTLVHPGIAGLNNRRRAFEGHDVVLLPFSGEPSAPVGGWWKEGMDKCGAAILLLLLAPLFLVLAILIRRDGGDALFRHQRLGANGRMFPCMKFRSMVPDSDRVLEQLLASDPSAAAEWQAAQKLRKDPRVTSVGRFLRKSSLDELPQLFNVLRGEMSLVGPRPIVRAEIVRYGTEIRYYYQARPGLTGLWQVSGRSDTSYAQRVELDVRYVSNWTFWRDVVIVLKTIPAVILRKGAV